MISKCVAALAPFAWLRSLSYLLKLGNLMIRSKRGVFFFQISEISFDPNVFLFKFLFGYVVSSSQCLYFSLRSNWKWIYSFWNRRFGLWSQHSGQFWMGNCRKRILLKLFSYRRGFLLKISNESSHLLSICWLFVWSLWSYFQNFVFISENYSFFD